MPNLKTLSQRLTSISYFYFTEGPKKTSERKKLMLIPGNAWDCFSANTSLIVIKLGCHHQKSTTTLDRTLRKDLFLVFIKTADFPSPKERTWIPIWRLMTKRGNINSFVSAVKVLIEAVIFKVIKRFANFIKTNE